jgi:hypothetical protein
MKDDQTIALLKRDNPVREADLPGPQSADAQALRERIYLDGLAGAPVDATRGLSQRRLALRVAAVAGAAAAIALGALEALPGGGEPSSASAIDGAKAALGAADGRILHVIARMTLTGPDEATLRTERTETWELTSPPYDTRQVHYSQGVRREIAFSDGRLEIYDPRRNTISTLPSPDDLPERGRDAKQRQQLPVDPFDAGAERLRDEMLNLLRSGEAREDGRVTIRGREAIRIVSPGQRLTLLVDARTYEPIEWSSPVTGIGTTPDTGVQTTRFETYDRLPATESNLALLDLRAQHPGARITRGITIDRNLHGREPVPGEVK